MKCPKMGCGVSYAYQRGCRCNTCKSWKLQYQRDQIKRKKEK